MWQHCPATRHQITFLIFNGAITSSAGECAISSAIYHVIYAWNSSCPFCPRRKTVFGTTTYQIDGEDEGDRLCGLRDRLISHPLTFACADQQKELWCLMAAISVRQTCQEILPSHWSAVDVDEGIEFSSTVACKQFANIKKPLFWNLIAKCRSETQRYLSASISWCLAFSPTSSCNRRLCLELPGVIL
jgi:hypothetical protein